MCDFVSAATGAGQAITAIGGFQAQSDQTAAQNKQTAATYNQQKAAYEKGNLDRLAIYKAKVIDTEINQDDIGVAVRNAISNNTLAESQAQSQLDVKLQDIKLTKLKGTGVANEGGRSRTAGKNVTLAAGRQEGAIAAQRDRLRVSTVASNRQLFDQANQERVAQWRSVNMGPGVAGPAPVMPEFLEGPSTLALGLQLAGAAATAFAPALDGASVKPGTSSTESFAPELKSSFDPTYEAYYP